MYVDVRRGLALFDRSDERLGLPSPARYDRSTDDWRPIAGAEPDDVICDVSRDGDRLSLRSAEPVVVRGASRSRLTFLTGDGATRTIDRLLSHWSVFDPSGRYALIGVLNGKGLPVVVDTATGDVVGAMQRQVDARVGAVDPVDGRLWAPDPRSRRGLLSIDCATGGVDRVAVRADGFVQSLRFMRDGASLVVVSRSGTVSRLARDGATIWSTDVAGIGSVGAGEMFLNECGSHLLLCLPEATASAWGEDVVIGVDDGRIRSSVVRRRGPPARLAADWFGDTVLTHAGEIVDFFSGEVKGRLAAAAVSPRLAPPGDG